MFTPRLNSDLVRIGKLYADLRGIKLTTASKYAAKSSRLLPDLECGICSVTTSRAGRVFQYFSDHWPADQDWPSDIPRPDPTPGSPAAVAAEDAA